jgi:hypothetical protein
MLTRIADTIAVLSLSLGAASAAPASSCVIDPVTPCVLEGEACNEGDLDTTNGGCNSTPNVFGSISIDANPTCGSNWAMGGQRDTDWYAFSVETSMNLEIEVRSETDTIAFIARLSPGGVCPVIGIPAGDTAYSGECDSLHEIGGGYVLGPSDYVLFVSTGTPEGGGILDGFPCPPGGGDMATMNAYEVSLRTPTLSCAWDLNGNGSADFGDIIEILSQAAHWGQPCPDGCPDLNGNGILDFGDILVVIGNWGPCPAK